MRVLITRPEEDAAILAADLAVMGIDSLIDSMLTINPMPDAAGELTQLLERIAPQALIISSKQALQFLPGAVRQRLSPIPAYAVGGKSAAAARRAGIIKVSEGSRDVRALVEKVAADCQPQKGPLLYLRGVKIKYELADLLPEFQIESIITYQAQRAKHLAPSTIAAWRQGRIEAALFYSVASFAAFHAAAQQEGLSYAKVSALTLSADIARAAQQAGFSHCYHAAEPSQKSLLALCREIKKSNDKPVI